MAHVTEKDYKKLAEAIADDLLQQDIPLNSSVTKLAKDMDLSQEQVRRLCEATNNITFNKMFNAAHKTAADRMIEFDVADPAKVLDSAIKEASYTDNTTLNGYELRPLEDEMYSLRNPEPEPKPEFNKVAFVLRPESKPREEIDRRTLFKVLDNMRHQKLAADMEYQDTIGTLRAQFRRLYDVTPFDKFEKVAVARFGNDAVKPLNEIREMMRLPQVEYNIPLLEKTAGFVDDSTPEMRLLQEAIVTYTVRTKLAHGIAKLEGVL